MLLSHSVTRTDERKDPATGFVMVTVLIILALLSLLSVGQLYRAITNQQESGGAMHSIQASYYAETAISYMEWAWANDADFDAYANVSGMPTDDTSIGDREEWLASLTDPGPTAVDGTTGAVMYWDNSSLDNSRAVCWPTSLCGGDPVMHNISTQLPRYIVLTINQETGSISPSIPAVPHPTSPVVGTDIPKNGAVVWLTAGDADTDYPQITAANCSLPAAQDAGCLVTGKSYYHVVVYAIGYVGGRPLHLMRAIIQ